MPWDRWTELEKTYHYVERVNPELFKEELSKVQRLCVENPEPQASHGGKRIKVTNPENVTLHERGNGAAYRIRKLRRDHADIAAGLEAGEFRSVAAAERAARGEEPHPPTAPRRRPAAWPVVAAAPWPIRTGLRWC